MIRTLTPDQRRREDALSINAGISAKRAIVELAQAAACEEALTALEKTSAHNEGQLWFLVRALCAEHGHDLAAMVEHGRAFARMVQS